jgi:hypothetical protein
VDFPPAERAALARAFVAKAVLNLPTTRMPIERVQVDKQGTLRDDVELFAREQETLLRLANQGLMKAEFIQIRKFLNPGGICGSAHPV